MKQAQAMQAWAVAILVTVALGGVAGAYLLARWDDRVEGTRWRGPALRLFCRGGAPRDSFRAG